MKFILSISALVAIASTASVNLNKRASPLTMTLTHMDGAVVKADLTNTGSTGYNLLFSGTILDDRPTDDLVVSSAKSNAKFNGMHVRVATSGLTQDAFVPIEAGQTISRTIDMADRYDMSTDNYDVTAMGSFPCAEIGSTELSGKSLSFTSNKVNVDVDGDAAAAVPFKIDIMMKRSEIGSGCSADQQQTLTTALADCAKLASAAADTAANAHGTIFAEYFKVDDRTTRNTVAARLRAVAQDCGNTGGGATTTHCTDQYGGCSSQVLAYTVPNRNYISYCGIFFSQLTPLADTCHQQDQATTILHEETHADGVYSPGTEDNGYGYSAATALSSSQAVMNADSYALYANAINLDCHGSSFGGSGWWN